MEKSFKEQLQHLTESIVKMGGLCEECIVNATKRLITGEEVFEHRAIALKKEIDECEKYIQMLCIKLMLKVPVCEDLKMINTAMTLISAMEQIGEKGKDIAEICRFLTSDTEYVIILHIAKMADTVSNIVKKAVMSFVLRDSKMANIIISHDAEVDNLFVTVKSDLLGLFIKDFEKEAEIQESLMIAKYLERVGDYTVNIAESVIKLMR